MTAVRPIEALVTDFLFITESIMTHDKRDRDLLGALRPMSKADRREDERLLDPPGSRSPIEGSRTRSLGVVESLRTRAAGQRTLGQMRRRHEEIVTGYEAQSLEVEARVRRDLRNQHVLNEAQRLGGVLENASLQAAGKIDEEQRATTLQTVASISRSETAERTYVRELLGSDEIDERQASELEDVAEELAHLSKRDALERARAAARPPHAPVEPREQLSIGCGGRAMSARSRPGPLRARLLGGGARVPRRRT